MHTLPQIQTLKGFLYLATAGGRRSWLSVTRASIDRTRKSEQVRLVLMCRRCRPLLNQTGNTLWVELSQRGNQKEKKGRGEVGDRAHLSCLLWRRALSLSVPLAEGPVVPTWRGGGRRGGYINWRTRQPWASRASGVTKRGKTSHILGLTLLLLRCTRPPTARHAAGTHHNHPHTLTHTDLHHLLAIQSLWSL